MPDLEPVTSTVVDILMIGEGLALVGGIDLKVDRAKEVV